MILGLVLRILILFVGNSLSGLLNLPLFGNSIDVKRNLFLLFGFILLFILFSFKVKLLLLIVNFLFFLFVEFEQL